MRDEKAVQNINGLELAEYCANHNESGAMRLLRDADCCKLDCTMELSQPVAFSACKIMYTPLMFACNNKMIRVCEELLKYPDRCNINHKTVFNVSALSLANNQGLEDIAAKIIQCKKDMKARR